jgi:hypothetical protein
MCNKQQPLDLWSEKKLDCTEVVSMDIFSIPVLKKSIPIHMFVCVCVYCDMMLKAGIVEQMGRQLLCKGNLNTKHLNTKYI